MVLCSYTFLSNWSTYVNQTRQLKKSKSWFCWIFWSLWFAPRSEKNNQKMRFIVTLKRRLTLMCVYWGDHLNNSFDPFGECKVLCWSTLLYVNQNVWLGKIRCFTCRPQTSPDITVYCATALQLFPWSDIRSPTASPRQFILQ